MQGDLPARPRAQLFTSIHMHAFRGGRQKLFSVTGKLTESRVQSRRRAQEKCRCSDRSLHIGQRCGMEVRKAEEVREGYSEELPPAVDI